MTKKDKVANRIIACLQDMENVRHKDFDSKWQDYSNNSGIVIKMEALLCFLLPLNNIPKYKNDIYNILPEKELKKQCEDIILDSELFDFMGTPYIDVTDIRGDKHGFIDSATFMISLIVYYEKIWEINSNNISKFQLMFQKSIEFIQQSYIKGKGWSFTNYDVPEEPFLYSTWMALDTISDLLPIKNIENKKYLNSESLTILKDLSDLKSLIDNLENKHINSSPLAINDKEYNQSITSGRIGFDDNDEFIHYNLWIVMSLLFLGSKKDKELLEALKIIQTEHQKSDKALDTVRRKSWTVYFETDNKIKRNGDTGEDLNEFLDRAFLAQYFKSLLLFIRLFPEHILTLEKDIEKAYEYLLNNREWIPENERINNFERVNYWDKYAEKKGYAIYYTERAIEALCSYYKYLELNDQTKSEDLFLKVKIKEPMLISVENIEELIENKLKDSSTIQSLKKAIEELENTNDQIKNKLSESSPQKRAKNIKKEMNDVFKDTK